MRRAPGRSSGRRASRHRRRRRGTARTDPRRSPVAAPGPRPPRRPDRPVRRRPRAGAVRAPRQPVGGGTGPRRRRLRRWVAARLAEERHDAVRQAHGQAPPRGPAPGAPGRRMRTTASVGARGARVNPGSSRTSAAAPGRRLAPVRAGGPHQVARRRFRSVHPCASSCSIRPRRSPGVGGARHANLIAPPEDAGDRIVAIDPNQEFLVQPVDASWLQCNIECQEACPVGTNCRGLPQPRRRGPLRGGVHPLPRPEPGRGDVRLRLLRPLRARLPPRRHRPPPRDPGHEAVPRGVARGLRHPRRHPRRSRPATRGSR